MFYLTLLNLHINLVILSKASAIATSPNEFWEIWVPRSSQLFYITSQTCWQQGIQKDLRSPGLLSVMNESRLVSN